MTKWCVTLLMVGALVFTGVAVGEDKEPKKEKTLSFELKDTEGKTHKLADMKDKLVVLEWFEPKCPAVVPHYRSKKMQKLAATYKEKGVVWLAVCSTGAQSVEGLKKFTTEHGVKHAVLTDFDGKVGRMFGAKTTPHMFVLKNGKVVYQGAIDEGRRGDKNFVAQALDELLAGKEVSTPKTRPYG